MASAKVTISLLAAVLLPILLFAPLFRLTCKSIGHNLRSRTEHRRSILLARAATEEAELNQVDLSASQVQLDAEWEKIEAQSTQSSANGKPAAEEWIGVIGFFHPFCNAGGGGERVLWAAILATQQRYPKALCVVYTGDHDVDKTAMLANVDNRFNIRLHHPRVTFLYLSTRHYVLASTWPHATLLGQSLGSLLLAWDAFNLIVPDVFIDTMGYAFALAASSFLFPNVPIAAYVHYPTISTDMLGSLDDQIAGRGVNAGLGKGWKGKVKRQYWELFARLYSWVGGHVDVVMTNSSWTQNHMMQLWGPSRTSKKKSSVIEVVFPPVAVEELEEGIKVDAESEKERHRHLLFISQFRPEKNHQIIITAFAEYMRQHPNETTSSNGARLILAGSVRDDHDKMLVYKLRVQAREAGVADQVDFVVNGKWSQILELLRTSSVGVNGMWNEHFGIGVVEYQAAGLISVVNDSGGPKQDIVVDIDGQPTGFHATTSADFAAGFAKALSLSPGDALAMRLRARKSAQRFTEEVFRTKWNKHLEQLVKEAMP